jgi:hypothetical protein
VRDPRWRSLALAGLLAVSGCGKSHTDAARSTPVSAAATVATVVPGQAGVPGSHADGEPWPPVPAALQSAVGGTVFVAGRAAARRVPRGCGLTHLPPHAKLVDALIDEFALNASYRGVYRTAAEQASELENIPLILGCTATWRAARGPWRPLRLCAGRAPWRTLRNVTLSGGGLGGCTIAKTKLLTLFVAPPRGSRWLVARRGASYAMAYPVSGRRPVLMTWRAQDAAKLEVPSFGYRFRYESVDPDGHSVHRTVRGLAAS